MILKYFFNDNNRNSKIHRDRGTDIYRWHEWGGCLFNKVKQDDEIPTVFNSNGGRFICKLSYSDSGRMAETARQCALRDCVFAWIFWNEIGRDFD